MAQRKFAHCLGEFQFEYIGDAKTDDEKCIGRCGLSTLSFVPMKATTLNLCFWVFNYQKRESGFCLHLCVLGDCLCECMWVRVTDWSSLFFFFRWVFARVLLIPQKLRRSKGADGKNSQSKPAWMPWKIPLSVCARACLFDPPSVCEWGSTSSAYTSRLHLHLSFINAWLPFLEIQTLVISLSSGNR